MDEPITQDIATTALVLANCGELTAAILRKAGGNDISNSLAGESLTKEMLENMTISSMARRARG